MNMINNDKFKKIDEKDMSKATGGWSPNFPASDGYTYEGHNVVDSSWKDACHFIDYIGVFCGDCIHYRPLDEKINGWDGYCALVPV